MRRVIAAAVSTVAGLIMLLSFKTHPSTAVAAAPAGTTPTGSGSSASTSASPSASSSGNPTTTTGTGTVTGNTAETRYGPVQVKVTVTNGQVTSVEAVEYPTSRAKDVQINSYAIPRLDQEATAAKSANIDMISGATYTSTGFISSLQSALNKAGVA